MSTLEKVRAAKNRSELAKILGFVPKGLTYTLFAIPDAAKYHQFTIPKRSGGERSISAPNEHLKLLQRHLATRLYECVREIEEAQPNRKLITHGFQKGRSIITNADRHRNRRHIFNIDIQDFFGAINFGRVRGFFIKDRAFMLQNEVATTIAQIACWQNGLPQGAPCSPVISNLVAHILDVQLLRMAKECRARYTRYADDITFSTNEREFPTKLAVRDIERPSVWTASPELSATIRRAGFEINPAKTRMQIFQSRQVATGLIVNKKVNVKPEYHKLLRAMCHELFKTGEYTLRLPSGEKIQSKEIDIIEGRLAFVYSVKARTDLSVKDKTDRHFAPPPKVTHLYRKFLFYKNFVANEIPIIITEGPSDIIYLRAALAARSKKVPYLYAAKREAKYPVRFLKHSRTVRDVLGLGEGVGGMGKLISTYHTDLSSMGKLPTAPVIILVDNDDGSKGSVFKPAKDAAKKITKQNLEISVESEDIWYHLGGNLYLIKVPHGGSKSAKVIEQLLPSRWLDHAVEGKIFNPKKKHGDHSALGKMAFAKKVVEANATKIDFSGFDSLLLLIEGAVRHFHEMSREEEIQKTVAARKANADKAREFFMRKPASKGS